MSHFKSKIWVGKIRGAGRNKSNFICVYDSNNFSIDSVVLGITVFKPGFSKSFGVDLSNVRAFFKELKDFEKGTEARRYSFSREGIASSEEKFIEECFICDDEVKSGDDAFIRFCLHHSRDLYVFLHKNCIASFEEVSKEAIHDTEFVSDLL